MTVGQPPIDRPVRLERQGAVGLIVFLVPVTFMMHNFWAATDPMTQQLQLVMFMKNVSLIGGALYFAYAGAGALSLDARAESRKAALRSTALAA